MTVARTEADPLPVGGSSSSRGDSSSDSDRGEAEDTPGDVSVEQRCSAGRRGTGVGVVEASPSSAGHSEDCPSQVDDGGSSAEGTALAAVSLTSSFPDLSFKETTEDDQAPVTGDRNSKDGSGSKVVLSDRRRLPEPGPLTFESLSGVELVCGDIFRETW